MKNNNKGFTLLELIVVIAIMAVMTALIVPKLSAAFSNEAMVAAKKIDAAISKCRIDNMTLSHRGNSLETTRTYLDFSGIANSRLTITNEEGSLYGATNVYFDRATGALKPNFDVVQTIKITSTVNNSTYYVDVYPATGYHEVRW